MLDVRLIDSMTKDYGPNLSTKEPIISRTPDQQEIGFSLPKATNVVKWQTI